MKYLIWTIVFIVSMSCKDIFSPPDGYITYQTFDEYSLKGVPPNKEKVESPYVFVKETNDTIFVIRSDKLDQVTKYMNKGDYWYSVKKNQLGYDSSCKCDTTPQYFVKYIFNNTILTYDYSIKGGRKYNGDLIVETPSKLVRLSLKENMEISSENEFTILKHLAESYKGSFPYYNREHQSYYYQSYSKVFKENMLYLHENNGTDELICLKDVRKLNSLGEFDPQRGISIIDKIQDSNKCK